MSWLSHIINFIREPIDQIKNLACEENVQSQACRELSDLSSMMGGTHTQNLILHLDEYVQEAIRASQQSLKVPLLRYPNLYQKSPKLNVL